MSNQAENPALRIETIRQLSSGTWEQLRVFVLQNIPYPHDDSLTLCPHEVDDRPWLDFWRIVRHDPHSISSFRIIPLPNGIIPDDVPGERPWDKLLREAGLYCWPPQSGRGDALSELAQQAAFLCKSRSLKTWITKVMGRRLTDSETDLCPERKFSKYDHQIARLCCQYGQGELSEVGYAWSMILIDLQHSLQAMTGIATALERDTAPNKNDMQSALRYSSINAILSLEHCRDTSGSISFKLVSELSYESEEVCTRLDRIYSYLLSPVTVETMKIIDPYFERTGPRFVVTCHNPKCGKQFYSGDKRVVTCPRDPRSGRRSSCKATWDAFRKWIKKHSGNPNDCWNDSDQKSKFLSQYQPRDRQTVII